MAALDVAVGAYPEPYEDVAAKPLDDRHSFARICRSQRPWPLIDRPRRKLAQDLLYQRQALLDFADADPDAGIDIAFLPQRRFELQRIVRRISWRASRIEASTRGAADITSAAELSRETWRQYARVDRPVLQRSGVVIELDQLRKAPATLAQQRTNERLALLVQIAPDPARHDLIHHKPMTEASIRRAQHLLAQVPALRVHHGKGGVIADGADVAEVIGEPFELAHERAQPHRASRHVDAVRSLDRPGESERVGHGAVAGHPPREHRGTFDGRAFHQPLDALVHVTKSRLEANDRLAVRGETEMPGLDDARVHGTHRNLVQALAFGRQEDVALCSARRSADYPFPVVEPGARIGKPFGFQPPQISDRAL